jgi:hypothetical protein
MAAAAPAAAAPAPLAYRVVRVKASMPTYRYLWNVLPLTQIVGRGERTQQQEKAFADLVRRAPKDIETYRQNGAPPGRSLLEILRAYAVLGDNKFVLDAEGAATSQLKYVDSAFWSPLQGVHSVLEDKKPAVHRLQCGSAEDPEGLLCTYVVCCLPLGAEGGLHEYVVAFVVGYDADTSTYAVLHTPNAADGTVLAQQQQQQPENTHVQAAALAPRYFEVPAARIAAFPGGRCMFRQYVKGQEVLARWEVSVLVTEPITHDFLRPRGQWRGTQHTTLLYPAEIVGGHGLEHVQVRYLSARGAGEDKVYTVHKRDVALPPEVGEPDEAERKRQRKARKKREEKRAAVAAAAEGEGGGADVGEGGAGSSMAPLLPAPLPSALAYPFPDGPESFSGLAPTSIVLSQPDIQRVAEWSARYDAEGMDGAAGEFPDGRRESYSPLPQGGSGGRGEGASSGGEGGGSGGRMAIRDAAYDDGGDDTGMLIEDSRLAELPSAGGLPTARGAPNAASRADDAGAHDDAGAPTPLRTCLLAPTATPSAAAPSAAAPEEVERPPSPPGPVGTVKCVVRFAFTGSAPLPPAMAPPSPQSDEAAAHELAEWRRVLDLPPLPPPTTTKSNRGLSTLEPQRPAGAPTEAGQPEGTRSILVPRDACAPLVRFGLTTSKRKRERGVATGDPRELLSDPQRS